VLAKLGADLERTRQEVVKLLSGYVGGAPAERVARVGQPPLATVAGGLGAYQEQEPPELVRVLPLAREVYRGYGHRIVLVSLEVWSGWLDLRYALLPEEPPSAPPLAEIAIDWRLSDDAGTGYELAGVASGGGRLLRIHQLSFRPAPPEGVGALTLTATDPDGASLAIVELDLTGAA
jgi:hypothetical protein